MLNHQLPIEPKKKLPIIATEKWKLHKESNKLIKKFYFDNVVQRVTFTAILLEYELKIKHHATFLIEDDFVAIALITKDINDITELDKEYARFADQAYRDVLIMNFEEEEQNVSFKSNYDVRGSGRSYRF